MHEHMQGIDAARVGARVPLSEHGSWRPVWRIGRYDAERYERECRGQAEAAGLHLLAANQWAERCRACAMRGDAAGAAEAMRLEMEARGRAERFMDRVRARAERISEVEGNLLLNEGINEMWSLICGGTATAYSNANAYLGVGDSTTAAAASQTGLQAVTNKAYQAMETGYPTYGTSQKATFRSVFGTAAANFSWQEFTIINGSDDTGDNMNRLVSDQGTKASGQTWTLDLEVTIS